MERVEPSMSHAPTCWGGIMSVIGSLGLHWDELDWSAERWGPHRVVSWLTYHAKLVQGRQIIQMKWLYFLQLLGRDVLVDTGSGLQGCRNHRYGILWLWRSDLFRILHFALHAVIDVQVLRTQYFFATFILIICRLIAETHLLGIQIRCVGPVDEYNLAIIFAGDAVESTVLGSFRVQRVHLSRQGSSVEVGRAQWGIGRRLQVWHEESVWVFIFLCQFRWAARNGFSHCCADIFEL